MRKASISGYAAHDVKQFIFAMKATSTIVSNVLGTFELTGRDNTQGKGLFFREGDGVSQMRARKTRRVRQNGKHSVAQRAVRREREVCGIYPAGISHK